MSRERRPLGPGLRSRRLPRGAVALAIALVAATAWPSPAGSASPSRPQAALVPRGGVLLGTTIGPPGQPPTLQHLEQLMHRPFNIVQHYYGWDQAFPDSQEQDDINNGRIPMIGWQSTSDLSSITSGQYDSMIADRANGLKSLGHEVFLRWGYEMNGNWFPWSGVNNNPGAGAKFVAAWKHIHDIFTNAGATNVVWVWAPNWQDRPFNSWNHWTNYYPGDGYVDWVGIDGFNWGNTQSWSKWTPLTKMLPGIYHDYAGRKPIMVAETASVEQGGNKARWVSQARYTIENKYPGVAAFIYYNDKDRIEPVYWAIDSSSRALSAFRAMGHDRYYRFRRA